MSSISRFKELNQQRIQATNRRNTTFVFTAYNSIDLTLFKSLGTTVRASVVNQQEKDQAYIYTELNNPLEIGSIWGAKGLNWLISEEIIVIKNVNWHKYKAFLCNVEIDDYLGYFIGPEKNFINVELEQKVVLQSLQHPILMMPGQPFNINDKILIKNRGWLIQEMDNISTNGITYYSLRETTMSKNVIQARETLEEPENITPEFVTNADLSREIIEIGPNIPIILSTENGYFKFSNKMIKIIEHSENTISFSMPYGVSEVEIQYKQDDNIITKTFKQVM